MKNNSLGTKILMAAVTLLLVCYFGFQAFGYFADPLSTTLAYRYQVEESVSLSGVMVRSEQVLAAESSGFLRLQREEGERVSDGGAVATVYADQASLDRQTEIDTLKNRIDQLKYAKEAALGVEVAQKLDGQIRQNILDYRAALSAGQLREAEKQGSELRAQILKRDYTETDTETLAAQITELQGQYKTLTAQAAGSVRKITAPVSGLYSAVVDGYESLLTPKMLEDLTPSALAAIRADSSVKSNVGKLVLGRDWYYAAPMSAEEAKALKAEEDEGKQLLLRFAKGAERDLRVRIDTIGPQENGRVVVSFRGDEYLPELTLLRQQSAQIIYHSAEGIRVPKEALRVVTEKVEDKEGTEHEVRTTGVYSVVGVEAGFKPVKVCYSGEQFVLVEPTPPKDSENRRLRPGEEIIVTAKDLYDGKVIR